MNSTSAKDSVNPVVTNAQLLDAITSLRKDVEAIKVRVGFGDTPVGMPDKKNYNTDPGPWQKKPVETPAVTQ